MTDEMTTIADAISRLTTIMEAKELQTKAPASTNTANLLHGVGGIFSVAGLERDIITAHVRPYGLGQVLSAYPTLYTDPRFGSLTGYTDVVGSEPTYPCDDAPYGYVKGCNLTAQFGRVARSTNTVEIDRVIELLHRGDFTDLVLHGSVLAGGNLSPNMSQSDILNIVTKSEMVIVGVNLERWLGRMLWQGNVANNNVGGGYKEFPGLDRQIATGQVDADTNVACPALDSDVKDFTYEDVCGTTKDIVEYMAAMEHYLTHNADTMGLSPVRWVLVMRKDLWNELSSCWPCKYLTDHCHYYDSNTTRPLVVNDNANINLRDQMRANMFLPLNGTNYPVVVDDGIFEHTNINNSHLARGEYASSIYFVPLTIAGGFPVTYWQYKDYRAFAPEANLLRGKEDFWTDDGKFSWTVEQIKWCYKLTAKIEPRVILRTPQLAGKIQNVKYVPLQHVRESDPDSPYWYDGGVSVRSAPTKYAIWDGRYGR